MKRFISTSLTAVVAVAAWACSAPDIHNFYLFSVYNRTTFSERVQVTTFQNWRTYMGIGDDAYFWFDADEIADFAQKKGDALMASYVRNLSTYLECSDQMRDRWDYPTKEQLQERNRQLRAVKAYAQGKLRTRLRSQHALLLMRCNMLLGLHQENIRMWEETASGFIDTVYKEMMRNIYAGALLKTGRRDEAIAIFAEQNDVESLYTYYYKERSFAAISREYQRDPNSPTLPFLVQDFVNNAQEAIDALSDSNWPGKLFVRDIKESEARQMMDFAAQVAAEGKTRQPALWKSAQAWLQYLYGRGSEARASIDEAMRLDGEARVKDNARVLQLYITAATMNVAGADFRDFIANGLSWLEQTAQEERQLEGGRYYDNHYTEVLDRLTHLVLVPRLDGIGDFITATAILGCYDELHWIWEMAQRKRVDTDDEYYQWNNDYGGDFFDRIDTLRIDRLEAYNDYLDQRPTDALDRWLQPRLRHDPTFMHELLGTKYLRVCQWQRAIDHLEQVPVEFINQMNIAPYMAQRNYTQARWMGKQKMKDNRAKKTTVNQKLRFAKEMLQMEASLSQLSTAARQQRAYDLAVRYYQASYQGDAWYLTRYGQSVMDTLRTNEADFIAKSHNLLQQASGSSDFTMQEKALYGLAYRPNMEWATWKWNDQYTAQHIVLFPHSSQYQALATLSDLKRKNAARISPYVSKCDVLKQFEKHR